MTFEQARRRWNAACLCGPWAEFASDFTNGAIGGKLGELMTHPTEYARVAAYLRQMADAIAHAVPVSEAEIAGYTVFHCDSCLVWNRYGELSNYKTGEEPIAFFASREEAEPEVKKYVERCGAHEEEVSIIPAKFNGSAQ